MYELFKEVFEAMPHVQRIWVNGAGEYWLHPKHGCELVEREAKSETDADAETEDKPKTPKKRK